MANYQATPQPAADPGNTLDRRPDLGHHSLLIHHRAGLEHRGVHHLASRRLPEQQGTRRDHHRRRVAHYRTHSSANHGTHQWLRPDELI